MEIRRNYNGSDAYMIERSITNHGQLSNDIANFTAKDSTFDAAFLSSYQDAIDNALEIGTDETTQDEQIQLTDAVLLALRNCHKKYAEMKYFAEKTFPKDKARQNTFGTNDYDSVRNSQPGMVIFMTTLHGVATKYSSQLIAKGCSQPQIDEILTVRNDLLQSNKSQEMAIDDRPVISKDRIEILNALYGILTLVNKLAQVVYYDDETKKGIYTYNAPVNSPGAIIVEGPVASNTSVIAAEVAYRANRKITFNNIGTGSMNFGLGTVLGGVTIQGINVELPVGESATLRMDELLENGTRIIANNNSVLQGGYRIAYDE